MKERIGQVMDLYWTGDGRPDAYYVRGHVELSEALEALTEYYELPAEELGIKTGRHAWARYVFAGWVLRGDGVDHALRVYDDHSRGAFPVTEFRVEQRARCERA